jgi:hypothetical protein
MAPLLGNRQKAEEFAIEEGYAMLENLFSIYIDKTIMDMISFIKLSRSREYNP